MQLRIPCEDYRAVVTGDDQKTIDQQIRARLAEFALEKHEIEDLTLSCVTEIANASSISSELEEQGPLKRFWGNLTGKNAKMQASLYRSNANVQYAHQQLLTRLLEQNASTLDFVVNLEKEHQQIILDIDQRQLHTNMQLKKVCLWLMQLDHVEKELKDNVDRIDGELDKVVFRCGQCGNFVTRERNICPKCGQILRQSHPALKTQVGQERFGLDLVTLSRTVQESMVMNRRFPSKGKAFYFEQIDQLERCAQKMEFSEEILDSIRQRCDKMRLFLKRQHIEIAIAGSVKAGKSSLINALLDEEIAAVETTPETSVLTKYRTTRSGNYIRVQFYNDHIWRNVWQDASKSQTYRRDYQEANAEQVRDKWINSRAYHRNQLSLEELKAEVHRFTYSKSADHFFVREVEVGICSDIFPTDVFLVDTPGLDDVVKVRSNVTRRYLNQADAVLACIKADSIHESSEAQFINRIMGNRRDKNTLFVVVTKKDQKSALDFDKDYRYFLRNVLEEMFNPDENVHQRIHAGNNCFGISALTYNQIRAVENGWMGDSSDDSFVQFVMKLVGMGHLSLADMALFAQPEALYAKIKHAVPDVKTDSGIMDLREQLYKRFIHFARKTNQQKAEEEFRKFRREINILLSDQTGVLREELRPLDADEAELMHLREQLTTAKSAQAELQKAISMAKKGVGK